MHIKLFKNFSSPLTPHQKTAFLKSLGTIHLILIKQSVYIVDNLIIEANKENMLIVP